MATRYRVQQFDWGFRTYDTQTEEPVEGAIAEFDVNMTEAELIEQGGNIEVIDDEAIVTPPVLEGEII
jgi:hypothetical protein